MALPLEKIKKLLVDSSVITKEALDEAENEAKKSGVPLTRYLIAEGKLTQEYLSELISKFFHIPLLDLRSQALKPEIVQLIPENVARERQVMVIEKTGRTFKVAMADPTDIDSINFLKEYLKGEIEPYLVMPEDLRFGYQVYKKKSSEDFEAVIKAKIKDLSTNIKKGGQNILENVPLAELFDTLLDYAAILDVSDIYFQPQEDVLKIRFRVDGIVRDMLSIDKSLTDGMVARVKTLSGLRIDEHFKPQDGRFRFHSQDLDFDIRTAIMPTLFGEKVTMRLLASAQAFLSFEELGMNEDISGKLKTAVKKPYGMVLSSGPTGSGKTTTIYAVLSLLNTSDVHITTIEDPIEYIVPNVSQTQVNLQAGITFPNGLRALMRHNPDIIFIGEVRDAETADVSVNAALTGHLLISTIHTNDAPSTVVRLVDLGIPPFFIGATLNAILAQRLARKICLNCIESYSSPPATMERIAEELKRIGKQPRSPKIMFKGKGCALCSFTGYKGRTGIFEILTIDEPIRKIIAAPELTLDKIREAANAQGMVTMLEDGLNKVERGITTVDELFRITTI
jgi:type IV pilus assembly protein PilB